MLVVKEIHQVLIERFPRRFIVNFAKASRGWQVLTILDPGLDKTGARIVTGRIRLGRFNGKDKGTIGANATARAFANGRDGWLWMKNQIYICTTTHMTKEYSIVRGR
jgi:hypothetical protein